jgi:hypothetical protein
MLAGELINLGGIGYLTFHKAPPVIALRTT